MSPVIPAAVAAILLLGLLFALSPPPVATGDLPSYGPAPELAGIAGWINAEPFTLEELRGKVVLIDFWTYSCINCIRTLPYLVAWDAAYRDQGLVIVGVHAPEFAFEHDYENVQAAVEKYGITYPVVLDNDFATWRAYRNSYWPRKYLIDREGNIRYDHIGEGAYQETEAVIQQLLGAPGPGAAVTAENVTFGSIQTPELYFGYAFIRAPLGNAEGIQPEAVVTYDAIPATLPNTLYLAGSWTNKADHMLAGADAAVELIYSAQKVHMVLGGSGTVAVLLDGQPVDADVAGEDVINGNIAVSGERLYRLVASPVPGPHVLELQFTPGVQAYSFTFG
ncbi:MAG: thioredoxin family protein [Candidatus Aenigmarchaeota archaeon]|nr:thioredoxin family protein [Candidatus Aenigmarchaeota archaeon]